MTDTGRYTPRPVLWIRLPTEETKCLSWRWSEPPAEERQVWLTLYTIGERVSSKYLHDLYTGVYPLRSVPYETFEFIFRTAEETHGLTLGRNDG